MSIPVYERATDLLEANLSGELVGLDVDAGHCFGFNAVATAVWQHLSTPQSFDDLKAALLSEYAVDSERCTLELGELLDSLVGFGLVKKIEAPIVRTK